MTGDEQLRIVMRVVRQTAAEGLAERRLPVELQSRALAQQEGLLLFARLGVQQLRTASAVVRLSEPLGRSKALLASLRVPREPQPGRD